VPLDHELKLIRASKHLRELDTEAAGWLDGEHHTVRYEYDPQYVWTGPVPPGPAALGNARYFLEGSVFIPGQGPGTAPPSVQFGRGMLTAYATVEQPPRDPISLLVGDALHNMRAALDNLAYALAVAFTRPLPEEHASNSEFPIFGDEDRQGKCGVGASHFNAQDKKGGPARGSGLAKIQGWHPDAQTVVEGLQPYQRGQNFRTDPLWILHDLDRLDKHRLLHTTIAAFAGTLWDVQRFRNVRAIGPGFIESLGGAVDTDTPIARICGIYPIAPNDEMHVAIHPALVVAFSPQTPSAAGAPVTDTLRALYDHIVGTVVPTLEPFL